jgi:predicted AlkP superfamily pyrophosphatase or phosphodiesterase
MKKTYNNRIKLAPFQGAEPRKALLCSAVHSGHSPKMTYNKNMKSAFNIPSKKRWIPLCCLLLVLLTPAVVLPEPGPEHVILISIDGLIPDYYLNPDRYDIKLPALQSLMQSGSYAESMTGVLPTLTYPSHTTLVTGVPPAQHGIPSNYRGKRGDWYLNAGEIQVKTLWQASEETGLITAIVTWPLTYDAEADYRIPENLAFSPVANVAELIRAGSTPGLFEALEKTTGPIQLLPFEQPEAGIPLDRMTASFASEVIRRHRPNLLLVHFLDADHRQHEHGPDKPEVFRSFERIDGLIGEILAAIQDAGNAESTAIFVVGDHGFIRVHTQINLAAILVEEGWLKIGSDGTEVEGPLEVRMASGSAAIYLKDTSDRDLADRLNTEFRKVIQSRFAGLMDWIDEDELKRTGGFPGAALALSAARGYMFTFKVKNGDRILIPSKLYKGTHGYRPDHPRMATGFIASGRGIRRVGLIPTVRMIDIAPTIAALLKLDLPDAVGLPMTGILEAESGK